MIKYMINILKKSHTFRRNCKREIFGFYDSH